MSKYGVHVLVEPEFAKRWKKRMLELAASEGAEVEDYDLTGGPLNTLVIAAARDIPVPRWVVQALSEAFQEYLNKGRHGNLEKALLGRPWSAAGPYANRHLRWRNKFAGVLMDIRVKKIPLGPDKGTLATRAERRKQARKFFKVKMPDGET